MLQTGYERGTKDSDVLESVSLTEDIKLRLLGLAGTDSGTMKGQRDAGLSERSAQNCRRSEHVCGAAETFVQAAPVLKRSAQIRPSPERTS